MPDGAVRLAFDVHGEDGAAPLLLGGSLGTTRAMWDPQVPALAERLRVVPFDHRGHGASPAPPGPYSIADLGTDVLALMDALGLERASFCGLSIGGMVGIWLAANAPERIDRLALICTSAHLPPAAAWRARAQTVRDAGSVAPIADAVVARWVTPGFAAARPDTIRALRAMLAASPPVGYAACCEAIAAMDQRPQLPQIRAATLVIVGEDDEATPPSHGERIADAVPGARLRRLGPMAHLGSVEQADAVTALLIDHLTTVEEHS